VKLIAQVRLDTSHPEFCTVMPDSECVCPTNGLGYTQSSLQTGVNRPELEDNHSPSYNVEFKSAWSYTSTAPCPQVFALN
jgi:hypothetical protein